LICGGFTGGGSHNAAWAISSGHWAGTGAARHAASLGAASSSRDPRGAGRASFSDAVNSHQLDTASVVAGVQAEVFPYDKNLFRTRQGMTASLGQLEALWRGVQGPAARGPAAHDVREVIRRREAAAMVATARWMYSSALERRETRGMHKHMEHPALDPAQQRRLVCGGLDQVWVRPEPSPAERAEPVAAE
jgi:succinate dehydrogenase/fumarate reductase flavoprotein subunit